MKAVGGIMILIEPPILHMRRSPCIVCRIMAHAKGLCILQYLEMIQWCGYGYIKISSIVAGNKILKKLTDT